MLYIAVYPLAKSVYFFRFHNQSNQFIDHKGMKQIQISKTFDTFLQSPLVSAKQTKEKAPIAIYYNIYYNHAPVCYFILHEASKRECSIKYKHKHKERNINIYNI